MQIILLSVDALHCIRTFLLQIVSDTNKPVYKTPVVVVVVVVVNIIIMFLYIRVVLSSTTGI